MGSFWFESWMTWVFCPALMERSLVAEMTYCTYILLFSVLNQGKVIDMPVRKHGSTALLHRMKLHFANEGASFSLWGDKAGSNTKATLASTVGPAAVVNRCTGTWNVHIERQTACFLTISYWWGLPECCSCELFSVTAAGGKKREELGKEEDREQMINCLCC